MCLVPKKGIENKRKYGTVRKQVTETAKSPQKPTNLIEIQDDVVVKEMVKALTLNSDCDTTLKMQYVTQKRKGAQASDRGWGVGGVF